MTQDSPRSTLLDSLAQLKDSEYLGVAIGREERLLDANNAYLRMIGCSREELTGEGIDWRAITPPEHLDRDKRALLDLRCYGACIPYEKEYTRKDGTRVTVLLGAVRLRPEPLEWACYVVDIQEQKAANIIEERNRELQEKTRIVNLLAHEINNPLAIVMHVLFLLQNNAALDSTSKQLVEDATRAVNRVKETVTAILVAATDTALPR